MTTISSTVNSATRPSFTQRWGKPKGTAAGEGEVIGLAVRVTGGKNRSNKGLQPHYTDAGVWRLKVKVGGTWRRMIRSHRMSSISISAEYTSPPQLS